MGKIQVNDWADLNRYAKQNQKLGLPAVDEKRVVFMGDSIIEGWKNGNPDFFENTNYINRGVGGQTTSQMLLRFRQDVIELKPEILVLLAGTNDIAENSGPTSIKAISGNIFSMIELALQHKIKVILCSVLPTDEYPWRPGLEPALKIITLNQILQDYCILQQIQFVNLYHSVVNETNGFLAEFCTDGVHPDAKGYKLFSSRLNPIIQQTLLYE